MTLCTVDTLGGKAPVVCGVTPYGRAGEGDGNQVMGVGVRGMALIHPGTGTAPSAGSSVTIIGHQPVISLMAFVSPSSSLSSVFSRLDSPSRTLATAGERMA